MKRILQAMPEEELRAALEGHENVLQKEMEKLDALFSSLTCPYCKGSEISKVLNPKELFKPGEPLPNYLARCVNCGAEFSPKSGILLTLPQPRTVG